PATRTPRLSSVPNATGPSNITGQPLATATGSTEEGLERYGKTAGQYFAESGASGSDIPKLTAAVAASTGIKLLPSQMMSPSQQKAATTVLDNYLRTGDIMPVRDAAQRSYDKVVANETVGEGGASGSPAPVGQFAREQAVPGQAIRPNVQPTQPAIAPTPQEQAQIDAINKKIANLSALAAYPRAAAGAGLSVKA